MSLFARRDLTWDSVPWGPGASWYGSGVKPLRLVPVYAAVSQIADMFASLPQKRYRDLGNSRVTLPLPPWLVKSDTRFSAFDWRYQFVTSLKLRGNAYGLVLGNPQNPSGVRWLHPDFVSPDESDPTGPRYWVNGYSEPLTLQAQGGQIIHVREFVQPGSVVGLSPVAHFRQVWETAGYAMNYGHDWFEKSAIPASLLMSKKQLKPGQAAEAKTLFREAVEDGGPVTLDVEWDYKQLTISPNEAQFLETIKASATLIANIFRVPPEDIGGESGTSRTYGNRESDAERFNVRTMLPLSMRYSLAIGELLPPNEGVLLDLDVLSRPNRLDVAKEDTERLRNGTRTLAALRQRDGLPMLTDAEVEFWQEHYLTQKSASESIAETVSESITKEA